LSRIEPSGTFYLRFTEKRLEETDERRVLDEASAKAEERQATITDDKDDETARVYGQIEDESLNGMTMYIEPSESQDTTKL